MALQLKPLVTTGLCVAIIVAIAGLAGCSSDKSAFSGKGSPKYEGPDPIPRGGGAFKVGKPYRIAGNTYTPREDPGYDREGTASWYGEAFHKRQTANGEWFDMNALTAAHPTLPLPAYVRVTNLKNGRSLVVRVNDRGPYAHDRIIDMSKRSAQVLGFQNDGITKVRVQYLGKAPLEYEDADILAMNEKYRERGTPLTTASVRRTDDRHDRDPNGNVIPASARSGNYFVQAASFTNRDNAEQLSRRLQSIGSVAVDQQSVGTDIYYRVRVGPLHGRSQAQRALEQVMAAGQRDAHVIAY